MGKLIASLNITLDGFCDHRPVIADEDFHRATNELLRGAAAVVLGRNTYGLFEHAWPAAKDDRAFIAYLNEQFTAEKYRLHELLKSIVLSDAFSRIKPSASPVPAEQAPVGDEPKVTASTTQAAAGGVGSAIGEQFAKSQ